MWDVSVIIVNWNTRALLADCLASVAQTAGELTCEVIVVDNASTDGSAAMVRERFPHVRLMANTDNVGFARANNQALAASQGRYRLLFNSDAALLPGALQALVSLAEAQPRAGIVGAHLRNRDGSFQASHSPFPTAWQEFMILSGLGRMLRGRAYPSHGPEEERGPQPVDYVEGACLLVRREAYEQVGGLDEGYFMYAEEVDWCYAMRQRGWQVWYQPAARVLHAGGASSQNRRPQREGDLYRSRVRFFRKHYGDAAARWLKVQILGWTALKSAAHSALRLLSRGRYGRPVVSPRYLVAQLRGV
jgi:hypothetical protein